MWGSIIVAREKDNSFSIWMAGQKLRCVGWQLNEKCASSIV